jgi:hypothetical protein
MGDKKLDSFILNPQAWATLSVIDETRGGGGKWPVARYRGLSREDAMLRVVVNDSRYQSYVC